VIGIVTIIAGLLIPPRPVAVTVDGSSHDDGHRPVSDDAKAAETFDFRLEISKLRPINTQ